MRTNCTHKYTREVLYMGLENRKLMRKLAAVITAAAIILPSAAVYADPDGLDTITSSGAADVVGAPADDNEDQTVDDSNVEIPEEQTPLVDGDGNDGAVDIEESETPLANTAEDESTVSGDVDGNDADLAAQEIDAASVPVAVPVIGGITAVFVVGLIVFLIYKNRKKSK